jgi:hypothetical protein
MYWIRKIYIAKQFRKIIKTKFREMYWYLKNLHNETISQNNLNEILPNFAKESTTKFRGISRNKNHFRRYFVFREIKKSYIFRDHPKANMFKQR